MRLFTFFCSNNIKSLTVTFIFYFFNFFFITKKKKKKRKNYIYLTITTASEVDNIFLKASVMVRTYVPATLGAFIDVLPP